MTSLSDLQQAGGIRSGKPEAVEITFTLDDGQERQATIHVKRLSIGETERAYLASVSSDKSRAAQIISEVISLGEDGAEPIPIEQADRMHPALAREMIKAINKVNGKQPKN